MYAYKILFKNQNNSKPKKQRKFNKDSWHHVEMKAMQLNFITHVNKATLSFEFQ